MALAKKSATTRSQPLMKNRQSLLFQELPASTKAKLITTLMKPW